MHPRLWFSFAALVLAEDKRTAVGHLACEDFGLAGRMLTVSETYLE